jgi:hypothetical protein
MKGSTMTTHITEDEIRKADQKQIIAIRSEIKRQWDAALTEHANLIRKMESADNAVQLRDISSQLTSSITRLKELPHLSGLAFMRYSELILA